MTQLSALLGRPVMAALLSTTMLAGTVAAQTAPAPAQTAAQRSGTNVDPAGVGDDMRDVGVFDLAQRMFALGRANQDPLLVIAAARLALSSPEPTDTRTPDERPTAERPAEAEEAGPDRATMVTMARQMAVSSGDATLVALAQNLSATVSRGRRGGAARDRSWVSVNQRITYSRGMVFNGQELAEVSLRGGPSARLNLYVYDESGNLICQSRRHGSNQFCSWLPRWTGPFRVVVLNVGGVHSEYILETN